MIQAVLVGLMALAAVCVGLLALVLLPLLLVGAVLKLLLFVILLPFRLLGFVLGALATVGFGLLKALFWLGLLVLGILLIAGTALALPLVPLFLIVALVWGLMRLLRSRPVPRSAV
jgi:hypothetical protein